MDTTDNAVAQVMQLFMSGDLAAQKAFLAACPPSRLKNAAVSIVGGQLDTTLVGLNMLAETYCRGIDCELGMILSKASYLLAQQAYGAKPTSTHLVNAARSAINWAIGLHSGGEHRELIRLAADANAWLQARGHGEATPTLLLYRAEAHLNLAEYDAAEAVLEQTAPLLRANQPAERQWLAALGRRLKEIARQRATELPPQEPSDREKIIQMRRDMLAGLKSLAEGASAEDAALVRMFADALEPEVEENVPDSLAEWYAQSQAPKRIPPYLAEMFAQYPQLDRSQPQSIMDMATDFMSGGGSELNQGQNRKRIRHATAIFTDAVQGHDPATIERSITILRQARDWAKEHHFAEDENHALWGLYLCYNRTQRDAQAIDALQALWANLEGLRSRIADPLERAGIMRQWPHLFEALCRLCYRTNRKAALADAIEGAKGRVVADVLTRKWARAVSDRGFVKAAEQLPDVMRQVQAHYLSYFVGDEETYGVLVARDGSLHVQAVPLNKATLREWSSYADPGLWGKRPGGLHGSKIPNDLPDRLAPLVGWLEPVAASGLLRQGDHICYCPDDPLHLIPLHYVTFLGRPLVDHVSVSRIHSALALQVLLRHPPETPGQFLALEIPAQQDTGNAGKISAFGQAPEWLAARFPGEHIGGARVDLALAEQLDWKNRIVHFATHGTFPHESRTHDGRDPNPYSGSGLVLAYEKRLPDLTWITSGNGNDTLLTPEKVLDLDLSGSHVTMQACVSGLAKEGIGGDALGLDWALLQAGAASLLATHWNVEASASAEFGVRFYRKWLVDRQPRGVAWRETMLELLQSHKNPYHWAAFSLSGDWR
ncbi:MAG TPA: CHAT domain-containing protein [Candidatus Tectomicrobia bacterium]|nr:CHAT domain-containing protein [Candidatus Tectomicrobia bacterium]